MSRKIREILLCVGLLGLPLLFLQANLKEADDLNPIDRLLLRISAPIQSGITAAVGGVHRTWRRYIYLVDVQQDNEALQAEIRQLKRKLRESRRDIGRLRRYEKLLAFRAKKGFETVGARIIGRPASPFVRVVRLKIDRGEREIRGGLPVVTVDGVIGRVTRVFGDYSDVMLTVDPKSAVDVRIERTGGRGLLRGVDGSNRYTCRIEYLLRREQVKVGDLVVTSGVAGVFPRDLPVGRISKVTKRTYGLYQEVEVTPSVDFSALEDVLVVLAPSPPKVIEKKRRAPQLARGLTP